VEPGTGCESVSEHEANCTGPAYLQLSAGDLNDAVRIRGGLSAIVTAGPGDDSLITGSGPDTLDGGGGHDMLRAGGNRDVLTDGDNPRTSIGPDLLDGGPGRDLVEYAGREGPVSLQLGGAGPQGEPGEGDTVTAVENATVESTADRVSGDAAPNTVQSFGSHAVLEGRGGDDFIEASWEGPDTVSGGPGDDYLRLADGLFAVPAPDTIACGSGRDRVTLGGPRQFVPLDCERVDYDASDDPTYTLRGLLSGSTSEVAAVAPGYCSRRWSEHGHCRFKWTIRASDRSGRRHGPALVRRIQSVRTGADGHRVALRLTRAGRRILRRARGLDARIGVSVAGDSERGFLMRLQLRAKP
jgi:hypothetical protein